MEQAHGTQYIFLVVGFGCIITPVLKINKRTRVSAPVSSVKTQLNDPWRRHLTANSALSPMSSGSMAITRFPQFLEAFLSTVAALRAGHHTRWLEQEQPTKSTVRSRVLQKIAVVFRTV